MPIALRTRVGMLATMLWLELYHFVHYTIFVPQVRQQQLLDTTAQKHKASLSQSKGLQSRRLPSNVAEKVPDDYSARRRAQTYSSTSTTTGGLRPTGRFAASLSPSREETDSGGEPVMTDEERKKKVRNKLCIRTCTLCI